MKGELQWAGGRECEWSFLSHEFTYFKGLGITKEDLVEEGVPVISYGQVHAKNNDGVHLKRELLRFIPRKLTEGNESSQLRRGDIVFADTSEDFEGAGNCVLIDTDDEVYAGYHTVVARPRDPSRATYYAWMFQSSAWRGQIQSKLCGIKVYSITRKILKGVTVITPSPTTRQRIVDYLDEKTAAIDGRVAVLEKKLAAYRRLRASIINHTVTCGLDSNVRMKDSGVDWIGKVPEGWAIKRIKDDYFLKGRIGWQGLKANEFIDEGPWLITGTDFDNGKIDWSRCYHISEERYRLDLDLQIHEGDLLVTKDGTVGKLAYIDHVPGLCSLNSHLLLMRPVKRGIDNRFMYWVLSSNVFRHYIEYESNGSTMQSLSQEAVSRFSYSAPKMEEQLRIARYLDDECVKIDRKVELVAKEIELYRKLKRSLVNEVVTGKRKVA